MDRLQRAPIMDAMSDTKLAVPPEFDAASKEERIEFVQDLWDRIAQDQSSVPVPDSHKQILDKRLDAYQANPHVGRPWNEVREELVEASQ
jgi:putative addiction module component (TIGR02574 family)